MTRDPALQGFLTAASEVLAGLKLGEQAADAIGRIDEALTEPSRPGNRPSQRPPVCGTWLPVALATVRGHSSAMARLVDGFAAIEPALSWAPRSASGPYASANWPENHANALIVGPGGLESRSDVQIGVSLLAPNVRYPDHTHEPEEVYLVLSPGRFQHGESGWFEPGIGGTLYNKPNVRHAMASDHAPLFAFWYLRPRPFSS